MADRRGAIIPGEVVLQHNKVVITASSPGGPSASLLGLTMFLEAYAKRFADQDKFPDHGFYGKLGGFYDRAEKGRVLAIYGRGDDALLAVYEGIEAVMADLHVRGVRFDVRLSNGLSAIPRLLQGFDDPELRKAGVTHYRIVDPNGFSVLLDQARADHPKYLFSRDV